jgi:hypothetical protein
MAQNELFPYYDYTDNKIKDGVTEECFLFCKRNFNSNCTQHYQDIKAKSGFHVCPYGFTTFIDKNNFNYSSFLVEKNFNRKTAKRNINKKDLKKPHSTESFENILNFFKNVNSNINAKQHIIREYDKNSKVFSTKKETLDDTLHELRKLNNILKKQAYTLQSDLERSKITNYDINLRSKNILSTTQLITARLNAYDFTLNPELIELTPQNKISIYKKFDKAKQCLEVITIDSKISIIFKGASKCQFECFGIIDLLPFIVFENALKFNYNKKDIICEFIEKDSKLSKIIISNYAILPDKTNLVNLKQKHFRGSNSEEIKGSGKGLYIANLICDFNNFNLEIETEKEEIIDNKRVGIFKVTITTTPDS